MSGHGWQVFAVIVVLLLINIVLGGVVQAILTAFAATTCWATRPRACSRAC